MAITYFDGQRGYPGTLVSSTDASGNLRRYVIPAMTLADSAGNDISTQSTYQIASNQTLASGATTTPVTAIRGGSYVWSYQFGGTTPSLVIGALGPDGTTYQTIATVTASGTQGIVLGQGSSVRLRNAGANPITALYSSLT